MKQLLQHFRTGNLDLLEVPTPKANYKTLVIQSSKSLISVGTERMLREFGKSSYLNKAKQQPEQVKKVVNKIKTEGLFTTVEAVWSKLNDPIPLGYSNVGRVAEVGTGLNNYKPGERVVSNGYHADYVKVPWTLAAKIPENVSDEQATFTVAGSICLEGVRLIQPTLGETIVVIGMGLLGQLVSQILQANGCRVICFDIESSKIDIARKMEIDAVRSGTTEENVNYVLGKTDGIGADGVIITASTSSEELLSQCALMSRKRGRIVLIGVIPITVPRSLFYEKELSFQVSSSYGPGRYDPFYEENGNDYPLPYVRWSAKRNMEAFLFLLEQRKIDVNSLVTHRFAFENVFEAYEAIEKESPLGIILDYPENKKSQRLKRVQLSDPTEIQKNGKAIIGFIGAGNFAKATLLPALKTCNVQIKSISSSDGYSASIVGKRFGISEAVSDDKDIFEDKNINTIFIATRHNAHASQVMHALELGKHVFVEKPLATNIMELKKIYEVCQNHEGQKLMVGFNRRFSPFTIKLQEKLHERSDPVSILITVNAGNIPGNHWVHDPEIGGGRIIGEACHFIDLARYLVGNPIQSVSAISTEGHSQTDEDKMMILLNFEDGSHAAIHYLANGNKKYPKERVEVFSSERIFVIDNFKQLHSFGSSLKMSTLKQNKGHQAEVEQFIKSIEEGMPSPISLDEIIEVHLATLAVGHAVSEKRVVEISELRLQLF